MQEPCLPRFLHHPLDFTSVVALFSLLLAPVLVAPVLGIYGRNRCSACGRNLRIQESLTLRELKPET